MNLIVNINEFNKNFVYFQEPINNTVINNSTFIRLIYSNKHFMINGLYLILDSDSNILKLIEIENEILSKINNNKNPIFKLKDYYYNNYYNNYNNNYNNNNNNNNNYNNNNNNNNNTILKISGVWETLNSYGLTYKIIDNSKKVF